MFVQKIIRGSLEYGSKKGEKNESDIQGKKERIVNSTVLRS